MLRPTATALAVLLSAAALVLATPAVAVSPVNKTFLGGTAIKGYDPVAYHLEGRPVKGSPSHTFEWRGAVWRFASAENRDRFARNPEAWAPAYGGYCAYAMSKGATADIDPAAWRIVDGRLYLNLNEGVQKLWEKDVPGYVALADAHWARLIGG